MLKPATITLLLIFATGCQESDLAVDSDGDGYSEFDGDCDDNRSDIYPGAVEVCDDLDNDCDGVLDEDDPSLDWSTASDFYTDADGDGYGDPGAKVQACFRTDSLVDNMEDCDDSRADIQPGVTEVCDDVDNDCDGLVDDNDDDVDISTIRSWYRDLDQDGYGDMTDSTESCSNVDGYISDDTDCDDTDSAINPGAVELCDEIDNDCDSLIDIYDPDVADASLWYTDADLDGFGDTETARLDCEPGELETAVSGDCDDSKSEIYPAAPEYCNGIDDDCDDEVDESTSEDASTWSADLDSDGYGDEDDQVQACSQPINYVEDSTDCDDTDPAVYPGATETCNDIDDDCDGLMDQADPDAIDQSWYRDSDGDGYGDPNVEVITCEGPGIYVLDSTDCDDTDADAYPGAIWYRDSDRDGYGDASDSQTSCLPPSGYVADDTDCDDSDDSAYPGLSWYNDIDGDEYGDAYGVSNDCEPVYGSDVLDNTDCDDTDADIYPDAEEVRGDGIDQDCDGDDVVWVQLSLSNDDAACALDSEGAIYCWGSDNDGEVDDAPTGKGYIQVDIGDNHACAVDSSGHVDCWGNDSYDECYAPSLVFEQVSVNQRYSCGIRSTGQIICWGDDYYNNVDEAPSGTFSSLEADYYGACAQYVTGGLMCWSGNSNTTSDALVDDVPAGTYASFSLGKRSACALDSAGELSCWGNDDHVVMGAPSGKYGPYKEVAVAWTSACTIDISGALYCWSADTYLDKEPAGTYVTLDMGNAGGDWESNACAIDTDGAMVCWGYGSAVVTYYP